MPDDKRLVDLPLGNENVTRAAFRAMLDEINTKGAGFLKGTEAARPAPDALNDRFFYHATDTNKLFFSDGAAWSTDLLAAGVTDHGALTGLGDDDHAQYHNNARGDARYDPLGEAAAQRAAHEAAADPHAGYQREVEKGAANGYAGLDANSRVPEGQSRRLAVVSVAVDRNLTDADDVVLVDAAGAARTMNLPTAVGRTGKVFHIKKTDASANAVIIDPNGAQTIDGEATKQITTRWDSYSVVSDGANWVVI